MVVDSVNYTLESALAALSWVKVKAGSAHHSALDFSKAGAGLHFPVEAFWASMGG
jgi:hypothetical protein